MNALVQLIKEYDQVCLLDGSGEKLPVQLVWYRPLTGRGEEISIIHGDTEVKYVEHIGCFDEASRKIAEAELEIRYFAPVIKRILKTVVHLGNRYFEVETECGFRSFVLKNPYLDIRPLPADGLQISDVLGNLYTIESVEALDLQSKIYLDKVM